MRQIMILTKNVLYEEAFQQKLQRLDYEVFCSSSANQWMREEQSLTILRHFQVLILSETFCNQEVSEILRMLPHYKLRIFRILEENQTEKNMQTWKSQGIDGWIKKSACLDVIREKLATSRSLERTETVIEEPRHHATFKEATLRMQLDNARISFSKMEEKVFNILLEAQNEKQILTRKELCEKLWDTGETHSNTSQLSSVITKLKNKLQKHGVEGDTILTLWGKGYRLSPKFYEEWRRLAQPRYGVVIKKRPIAQSF